MCKVWTMMIEYRVVLARRTSTTVLRISGRKNTKDIFGSSSIIRRWVSQSFPNETASRACQCSTFIWEQNPRDITVPMHWAERSGPLIRILFYQCHSCLLRQWSVISILLLEFPSVALCSLWVCSLTMRAHCDDVLVLAVVTCSFFKFSIIIVVDLYVSVSSVIRFERLSPRSFHQCCLFLRDLRFTWATHFTSVSLFRYDCLAIALVRRFVIYRFIALLQSFRAWNILSDPMKTTIWTNKHMTLESCKRIGVSELAFSWNIRNLPGDF